MDPDAIDIVERLTDAGFDAYLVGGCVRDLLLGRMPKDFDIATSARPRQAKRVLPRARIIGRRFRLVHAPCGRKIFEVSTFRKENPEGKLGAMDPDMAPDHQDAELIVEDNIFGNAEEDARRRDLTVNALFYDVRARRIIDYVDGLDDIDARLIRTIGDPIVRFKEDPIRILRAIRHAGILNLDIEPATLDAIRNLRDTVTRGAAPRILEEILRTFRAHAAASVFDRLIKTQVLEVVMPELAEILDTDITPFFSDLEPPRRVTVGRHLLQAFQFLDRADAPLVQYLAVLFLAPVRVQLLALLAESGEAGLSGIDVTKEGPPAIRSIARRLQLPRRLFSGALKLVIHQKHFLPKEPGGADDPDGSSGGGKRRRRKRGSSPTRFMRADNFTDALLVHRIDRLAAGDEDLKTYFDWVRRAEEVLGNTRFLPRDLEMENITRFQGEADAMSDEFDPQDTDREDTDFDVTEQPLAASDYDFDADSGEDEEEDLPDGDDDFDDSLAGENEDTLGLDDEEDEPDDPQEQERAEEQEEDEDGFFSGIELDPEILEKRPEAHAPATGVSRLRLSRHARPAPPMRRAKEEPGMGFFSGLDEEFASELGGEIDEEPVSEPVSRKAPSAPRRGPAREPAQEATLEEDWDDSDEDGDEGESTPAEKQTRQDSDSRGRDRTPAGEAAPEKDSDDEDEERPRRRRRRRRRGGRSRDEGESEQRGDGAQGSRGAQSGEERGRPDRSRDDADDDDTEDEDDIDDDRNRSPVADSDRQSLRFTGLAGGRGSRRTGSETREEPERSAEEHDDEDEEQEGETRPRRKRRRRRRRSRSEGEGEASSRDGERGERGERDEDSSVGELDDDDRSEADQPSGGPGREARDEEDWDDEDGASDSELRSEDDDDDDDRDEDERPTRGRRRRRRGRSRGARTDDSDTPRDEDRDAEEGDDDDDDDDEREPPRARGAASEERYEGIMGLREIILSGAFSAGDPNAKPGSRSRRRRRGG